MKRAYIVGCGRCGPRRQSSYSKHDPQASVDARVHRDTCAFDLPGRRFYPGSAQHGPRIDPRGDAADVLDSHLRFRDRFDILLCVSPSPVVIRRVESRFRHIDGHPHIHRRRNFSDVLGRQDASRDGAAAAAGSHKRMAGRLDFGDALAFEVS